MNKGGQVTSIVKDHVQGFATLESGEGLLNAPSIFFLSFTFPGEDWNTGRGNATHQIIFLMLIKYHKMLTQLQHGLGWRKCSRKDCISYQLEVMCFKHTQEDQVTSAPRAVRVSIKTAVWIVLKSIQIKEDIDIDLNFTCAGSQRYERLSKVGKVRTDGR